MAQPTYHLRPHKAVDRNLFCETLRHLSSVVPISERLYIGFGSYEFDEFKLLYRNFGIAKIHTIERDTSLFIRQKFNKPYEFIELFNKKCSEYIDENYDSEVASIFWMDFSTANDKASQCEDISNLFSKIKKYDVVRVTVNAHANSIPIDGDSKDLPPAERCNRRFDALKSMIGDYLPPSACEKDVETAKYPFLLLNVIKNAAYQNLSPEWSVCPICAYIYSDGQQMLTVTMIVVPIESRDDEINRLNDAFCDWRDFVCIDSWDKPIRIELPDLTILEQLQLGKADHSEEGIKETSRTIGISVESIKKYYRYIRYYPNYQQIMI